jgi:hypothetical protein
MAQHDVQSDASRETGERRPPRQRLSANVDQQLVSAAHAAREPRGQQHGGRANAAAFRKSVWSHRFDPMSAGPGRRPHRKVGPSAPGRNGGEGNLQARHFFEKWGRLLFEVTLGRRGKISLLSPSLLRRPSEPAAIGLQPIL